MGGGRQAVKAVEARIAGSERQLLDASLGTVLFVFLQSDKPGRRCPSLR